MSVWCVMSTSLPSPTMHRARAKSQTDQTETEDRSGDQPYSGFRVKPLLELLPDTLRPAALARNT